MTAATSRAGSRLAPAQPWAEWRTFITRSVIAFRLSGSPLERGDTVTITYGDGSAGGPGLRIPRYSNDRLILPVQLDFEGRGEAWTPKWPSLEVLGAAEIQRVTVLQPSVIEPGEPFTLAIRSEDRWKNLSSAKTPEYELYLDGRRHSTLPAGSSALHTVDGLRVDEPGVHRFEVRTADGRLRGGGNPLWVEKRAPRRVFWGDTHGHSGFAEGQGSPDGYYRFGRDVARLDFLSLSEHDMWMDDREWLSLILDGATAASRVTMQLAEVKEFPADPGARDRSAADLPSEQFSLALGDLMASPWERELQVVRNIDRLRARLVAGGESLDSSLEYRDTTAPSRGDWYFLRIGQVDGAMAWSSPWWVGAR